MRYFTFVILLLFVACSMPKQFSSSHHSPEDLGYGCEYSFFVITNKTADSLTISIDRQVIVMPKGKKHKQRVRKGTHNLCVGDTCEDFRFYPCMSYDFTPTIL